MKQLEDTDAMPYGKHKGEPMSDVPANYFHYLWQNGLKDDKQMAELSGRLHHWSSNQ